MRRYRTGLAALTIVLAGGLLAGCAPEPVDPPPTVPASPSPTATPSPTPAPEPEPTAAAWERFADPRTPGSFEIPPGWSVVESEESEPEHEIFKFDLLDAAGTKQLTYARKVMGLGGGCGGGPNSYLVTTELDAQPLEVPGYVPTSDPFPGVVPPQFSYRVFETVHEPGVFATVALSDTTPTESCFYYNLLMGDTGYVQFADTLQVSVSDAVKHFDSADEARAYMDTDEYATLKRVLLSFRLDS